MDYSKLTNEKLNILLEQEKDGLNQLRIYKELAQRLSYYIERENVPRYDTSKETYKTK
jgi:hypothetical protein